MRVQHPKVHQRKDRKGTYWFFRYWHDELLPDGSIKTSRKFHTIGPSKGEKALTKREAEAERDRFLSKLNAAPTRTEAAVLAKEPPEVGAILFGKLAEMWREDYVDNPKIRLAEPTRIKYRSRLENHILPRWRDVRIGEMRSKEILDWLQAECTSWHMMVDLRNIMSGIFTKAQEWELLPETFANPMSRVKIGRKWMVRPERILGEQETVEVLGHLDDPHRLICETCLSTGARISEVLGLQRKHLNLEKGTVLIEQRHCRGDIDVPKTKNSRRVLTLGALVERYREWIAKKNINHPDQWLFAQEDDRHKPMWDSGVRKVLKIAAVAAECDFPGFGLHSLRRANITWRQEVGASAIEASKIAGHASVNMTNDYTHVQLKRQEELTRAIQERLGEAALERKKPAPHSAGAPHETVQLTPVSCEDLESKRLASSSFSHGHISVSLWKSDGQ
ncbi:MAG: tyrosine-type recombinase/integrase [Acidobacteria bacterium]|nr:tyrosine-type recombinase/integrase [Acidobacteriota bacterium]